MIVIGAKGHASEMYPSLLEKYNKERLFYFDNILTNLEKYLFDIPIIKDECKVSKLFEKDPEFTLGIGNPNLREKMTSKFIDLGGDLISIIDSKSTVDLNSTIGKGVNIMPYAAIFSNAVIETGVLINSFSSVHHDCFIGEFSELSPGSRILGGAKIGRLCSIGANTIILPGINVCDNVKIGAGAVVTKDITTEGIYIGIPAIKK
ncbi:NeuD/PglB/VioB family sugar acetyltransferase [Christiangramia echinicola]|uniref:Sugar O-acyltransferase, sialic acid O-acetyltransferase NeuD family n=1 Tax=Christiangramia echinicola TaxID=279359 RepID=A0A1H1QNX9_9FLAO|nr:NeuD/PglB/VioB family sugar acetyltransferase [Christiangramia echinicola]SDS25180.1 sugar O-acyltransferase, sialic acid O-acetyltransferase NeuD family [Christiangramia echinicola]